jgi:hypothetical protein
MILDDLFDEQEQTAQANPLQALMDRNKAIETELESLRKTPAPKLDASGQSSSDDLETMSSEILRGFFQGSMPPSQTPNFGDAFRQSISPGREVLANMLNGVSASLLGTKFQTVRDQAFQQFATQQRLEQERQATRGQLMQGMAQQAQQIMQQRAQRAMQRSIEEARLADNEQDRALKIAQAQQVASRFGFDLQKEINLDKDRAEDRRIAEIRAQRTGNDLYDIAKEVVTPGLVAKGIDLKSPQGLAILQDATVAKWKELEKVEAAIKDKPSAAGANIPPGLISTVLKNPALFDTLTPTIKGAIAPDLAKLGFEGFGRPVEITAVNQLVSARTAMGSLQELRTMLEQNKDIIGPLKGLAAINPFNVRARVAQAEIDRVRQRVGKDLEGGVLRKEDEAKYQKILATLRDEPATAISKVDGLIADYQRNLDTFIGALKDTGRNVSRIEPVKPSAPAASHRYNPATGKIEVIK